MNSCFVVEGEWLTEHCRSLWAREDRQDLAIRTLVEGIQGFDEELAIRVLTGKAKLVGDSSSGIRIEDDDAEMPSCVDAFRRANGQIEEAEEKTKDLIQLRNGDTAIIASPTGRRLIPRRRANEPWPKVPNYVQLDQSPFDYDGAAFKSMDEKAEEVEPLPKSVPEMEKYNFGWLSPDGDFYACDYGGHLNLIYQLGFFNERAAEKLGWVKLAKAASMKVPDFFGFLDSNVKPTVIQVQKVLSYCKVRKIDPPDWARSNNDGEDDE